MSDLKPDIAIRFRDILISYSPNVGSIGRRSPPDQDVVRSTTLIESFD